MSIECERMDAELRKDALDLIEAIWHGIDWESVTGKRRMKIYDEYAAKIRSSAHTGRFTHFFGNLCRKMESLPQGKWAQQARISIERVEKHELDLDVLELIMDENQYLVLLLRDRNDTRKAEREEAEAKKQTTVGEM